jgi:hypothetical protein
MRQFVAVVFILVSALALSEAARPPTDEKYTTKYDNNNVEIFSASNRLMKHYFKCLMDIGPCTPAGTELKCKF